MIFILALHLAFSPNRAVPQVLGAHTGKSTPEIIDKIERKEQRILAFEKISENKIETTDIKKHSSSPSSNPQTNGNNQTNTSSTSRNSYSEQILDALNNYRQKNGVGTVQNDQVLCNLAQSRAEEQARHGGLDSHKGFNELMANKDNFTKLNVQSIGENSSWNYDVSAKDLIENVFSSDDGHQKNQLNPNWTLACAGVSEKTVNIIFADR